MKRTPIPTHEWWKTSVVYQIYPRSFQDTTGNGVGDLDGVTQRLDYLSDVLGVDAIWLSPFYPSPMADFGYDVSNYVDVDPLFGDLAAFDRLVEEAHRRGLKVIVDFVPNHSSDQHAWFLESRSSRDNPKRDWYVWRDAKPDGSRPNNWLSIFGGPAWEWDEATGQYYLHSFLKEQPDLNWRNPAVQEAMLDAMRFWLERGIDGYRIDVAHFLMKDPLERDNPPNESGAQYSHKPMGDYDSQIHLYDHGHEDIHEVYREMRRLLDAYSETQPRYAIGEIHEFDWPTWASYYGENLDELHMPFNFATLKADWSAEGIREIVDNLEAVLPAGAWPNYVLSNHDEPRLATRYGPEEARLAVMLLLTLRGTPTLYYGDELGMQDPVIPEAFAQDPWGISVPGLSRDGCRTPMQWDATPNAGFSNAESTWLPVHDNFKRVNVAVQRESPASMLALYQGLLAFRKTSPALQVGDYHPMNEGPPACFLYKRETSEEKLLIGLNFSSERQQYSLNEVGTLILSTVHDRRQDTIEDLVLEPNEGVIIRLGT